MDVPSLSTGIVGSRFVSQDEIDSAKARRDEQWRAAYARLGQEPPPQPVEDSFDGRSLAEKLAANRAAKQEEWEEKTKLANQFRALEEDEIMFLDSVRERQEEEERQRKEKDGEEVRSFKEAVAARTSAANNPPPILSPSVQKLSRAPAKPTTGAAKKDTKKSLKGVLVKKKTKPTAVPASESSSSALASESKRTERNGSPDNDAHNKDGGEALPQTKRRKISES